MSKIYAIGETVYDIIFKNDIPVAAKAGGSMLNTAVSLGRLGLPVHMITEYGYDPPGDYIHDFLNKNNVDTSFTCRYHDGKTAAALAYLNKQNDARYSFYKIYPKERLRISLPAFSTGDLLLFGAFYSLLPEVRKQVTELVHAAKKADSLVIYDPNIRSPHKNEILSLREDVYENISLADVVRGSDEDFRTMFDVDEGADAYEVVKNLGCDILLYTKSSTGVEAHLPGGMMKYPVPAVDTVSTIGAGDSFNAGLIYELFHLTDKSTHGIEKNIEGLVKTAIRFGSHVCTHYENYVTEEFADQLRSN